MFARDVALSTLKSGSGLVRPLSIAALALGGLMLAGCEQDAKFERNSRHYVPINPQLQALISEKGMTTHAPILLRAFKKESELEVWKADASGEYKLLKTYPMCRWSGQLGPKKTEGDRQVPEGFYAITQNQLNPYSSFYLSFNVGYPNSYDKAYGRTGSHIMVHGACSSRGCFSMTDEQIAEIYALTREAFAGGQKAVQLQSLPFRMTPQNFAKFRADENLPFWKNLKEGADVFEVTKREPQVSVCSRRYVFGTAGTDLPKGESCPPVSLPEPVVAKLRSDEQKVAELSKSTKAVKRIYKDGDQHPVFQNTIHASAGLGDSPVVAVATARPEKSSPDLISRPEALAFGAVELPAENAKGLSRAQLIARAEQHKMQEVRGVQQPAPVVQSPAAPASKAVAAASPAAPKAGAPAAVSPVTAMAPAEPKKDQPAFYNRIFGAFGSLTASAADPDVKKTDLPVPPKRSER